MASAALNPERLLSARLRYCNYVCVLKRSFLIELIAIKIKYLSKTVGALLVLTLKDGKQMKEAGRANKTRCNGVIFRAGKPICKQMSCKLKCSTTICCQTLNKKKSWPKVSQKNNAMICQKS